MMRNLAGNKECDGCIAEELRRSMIPSAPYDGRAGEVPSKLRGHLSGVEFRRAWTYWVARGPVPIEIARRLYEDPIGRTDIRVDGHCGCPPPHGDFVTSYHIDTEVGLRLFADAIRSIASPEGATRR